MDAGKDRLQTPINVGIGVRLVSLAVFFVAGYLVLVRGYNGLCLCGPCLPMGAGGALIIAAKVTQLRRNRKGRI